MSEKKGTSKGVIKAGSEKAKELDKNEPEDEKTLKKSEGFDEPDVDKEEKED